MRTSAWVWAVCVAATAPGAARATPWHLYPADCEGGTAPVEIACGAYGRYLLDRDEEPGCTPLASGVDNAILYPPPEGGELSFPIRARRLREASSLLTAPQKAIPAPSQLPPWIGVVDFVGSHGDSTTWLAQQVGGVTGWLVGLDRPQLPLGPVGDFHVLAALCDIAETVHRGEMRVPHVVNMSFGRRLDSNDPASSEVCKPPAQPRVPCEIAKVIKHLADRGTTFVGAAGNHGQPLFPASLAEVTSVGMLDLTLFFDVGGNRPAWETPPDAEALIPGNSLCLAGWAAPSGSSYSSAMLAGWMYRVLRHPGVLASLGPGRWVPDWNDEQGCFVLARTHPTDFCNPTITGIFDELSGSSASCWNAASEPVALAPGLVRAGGAEPLPSQDQWRNANQHPTPESDPCVPCSGVLLVNGSALDLRIDISQSEPLPDDIVLDEVDLRVDETYYELSLTAQQLEDMGKGELAYLLVPNMGAAAMPDVSASLWYRMREQDKTCQDEGACFWSSTPLLIDK